MIAIMYLGYEWECGKMAQGLQCFDANGNMTLDVTDRLTRVLGEFNTGTFSGSLTDTNLSSGTPWYILRAAASSYSEASCTISFGLQSISWTFGSGTPISKNITYGVY